MPRGPNINTLRAKFDADDQDDPEQTTNPGDVPSLSSSTQGVTLTDLQEAEKTIGRARPFKTREEEKEEREKQDKEKQQEEKKETETKEDDYRSKYLEVLGPSVSFSPLLLLHETHCAPSTVQRYRSSSTSTSALSAAGTGSTPSYSSAALSSSSSSLSRPNSLTGITSSYSRSSRDTEKGQQHNQQPSGGELILCRSAVNKQ